MSTDKVIVALDFDDAAAAWSLVDQVREHITFFKVGSQLFTRHGPEFVRELRAQGLQVFLDLKYHDIPATVEHAVHEAVRLGVNLTTIHTSGGTGMMQSALRAAAGSETLVLGVTVLTSMDDAGLRELGVGRSAPEQVLHLANLAHRAGLRGLVCSPLELPMLRNEFGPNLTLVTPGIRSTSEPAQDQKRTLSAQEALENGASYLVVGRPITRASDPRMAAQQLMESIWTSGVGRGAQGRPLV